MKHQQATRIWEGVATVISNIFIEHAEVSDELMIQQYATNPLQLQLVNREIARIDLGIKQVNVVQDQGRPSFQFVHDNLAVPMPLHLESAGTRHFLKLYPMIAQVLATGGVALIDEMDASIHPLVLPEILRWFHDRERNPLNAQLWMTCHNASLLDSLVKEEILFTEKDSAGRTTVYGMSDIKGIRREDNFYRKYLSGVFGAVPQIG
ncbi:ATP-binding protein [Mesorhizobium sp. M1312]|uniref:AAA family ATPase n=1 Tax=unclassified Mesorhizobium TaxID=325217 RepID=UPI0033378387